MFEKIRYLSDKIENLLKIGKYTNAKGANGQLQQIQIKTLRNIEDAMKVGQFGFNSKAPIDSRCIVARIGNESIVIANEHLASIIDIASGDSILYNENGDFVKVEKNKITITANNVEVNATTATINADLEVDGDIKATGDVLADGEVTALAAVPAVSVSLSTHQTPTQIGNQTPIPGT